MTFLYISLDSFHPSYLISPSDWDWWSSLLRIGLFNLCVVGSGGERKRERAGNHGKGKEKRELPPFPSSHRPPRSFYFFDYCYIYRDTQRGPMRRRELMESYRVAPTFESVNDILWCDHSNGTCSAVLSHSNICFSAVYTKKLGIFVDWWIYQLQEWKLHQEVNGP